MDSLFFEKLKKALEPQENDLYQLIRNLIRIQSYSGQEKEIVEFIVATMRQYGFDEAYSDGLGNAIGRIGNGPIKIMFDAHIDTVHVTSDEKWTHPPFEGVIEDGKLYGRGVVDEKPAMAGFMMAGKIIKELFDKQNLPFSLYMVGSVQEEDCDGYPLTHIIEKEGILPDYVLLGEPTDLRVYRGQRGRMEIQISTHGKSAHGAHNEKGISAINKMIPVLAGIEKLNRELPVIDPLGKGSITTSQIVSRAPSVCSVPDYCMIHIDRRMTYGETRESVLDGLKSILAQNGVEGDVTIPVFHGTSWKGTTFKQEAYFPTWITDESHPLVQAGLFAANQILGPGQTSSFWSFSTNGVSTAGTYGIPTIGFAPGKEELSHSSREELELKDLFKATQFYAAFPFILS